MQTPWIRIKRLENNLKALKSALGESTVAGNKKREHLRRMEAAYQDKVKQEVREVCRLCSC